MSMCRCILFTCALVAVSFLLIGLLSTLIYDETSPKTLKKDPRSNEAPFPNGEHKNIFWFVQMTDIHISIFRGTPDRLTQFRSFLGRDLDHIRPDALVITGDLTDAKDRSRQGSQQYEEEWIQYRNAIKDSRIEEKTVVLDIRGNHDAFNVPQDNHESNMYVKYSVRGRKNSRSYLHVLEKPFGRYAFLGVDSCPEPGIKRPFNFFGYLEESEWKRLDHLKVDAGKTNATVWFGHYPSSVVISENHRHFKSMIGDGTVYLCGHLHTLGGLAPKMVTVQKAGNLELELGDWLDNRLYRILAFDHDILSFTDQVYNHWPAVLITNPAHADYLLPDREPSSRIKHSTHIRILAFSPSEIMSVKVYIDGSYLGEAKYVGNSLYVIPWTPQNYPNRHSIKVQVIDAEARERVVKQPFVIDASRSQQFPMTFANFLLHVNGSNLFQACFLITWLVAIVPLICLHIHGRILRGQICGPFACFMRRWQHHFLVLCRSPTLFYPILLFNIYIACGPWFIGYVMDDYIGIAFSFGVYVKGEFLPMHTTLMYGVIQLITFNIPLTVSLAIMADGVHTKHGLVHHSKKAKIKSVFRLDQSIFYSVIVLQILKIVANYLSYGTLATLSSPVFFWPLVFAFVLKRRAYLVNRQLGGH